MSANTFSAATYLNLPADIYITGGTYSAGTLTLSRTQLSNITITGFTNNAITTTYSQLVSDILGSKLLAGSFYLISDYQTCYDQPDFDFDANEIVGSNTYKQGPVEPILVLAIDVNKISSEAYQPEYPNDRIQYDWTFSATEVTTNVAFGRITERIDEFNNRTSYDHRNILFKRYKTYFYNLNNPEPGKLDMSNGTVTGTNTLFTNFNINQVIYVIDPFNPNSGRNYKIISIADDLNMVVSGETYYNNTNLYFYSTSTQIIGSPTYVPYTHTQMQPPINLMVEASFGDFTFDGSVQSGDTYFGSGSNYFTNTYPGLFVMIADNVNIDRFELNGDLGADGNGSQNVYTYTVGSNNYTAFVKRVYNAGDPSINEIIIVNTDGSGIVQTIGSGTNSGLHKLENLAGVTQVSYLLTALDNGNTISDLDIDNIVNQYLLLSSGQTINNILTNLNTNYSNITGVLPSQSGPSPRLYYFNDVGTNFIGDGGNDMYDTGNYIVSPLYATEYKSFEFKSNNIVGDSYVEVPTFRFDFELDNFGEVISKNNYLGQVINNNNFLLPNTTFGSQSYNNTLNLYYNNSFADDFYNNTFVGELYSNVTKNGFYNNTIGDNFNNNKFNGEVWRNKFGVDFYDNEFGSDVQNNIINNGFNNNFASRDFYRNEILNGFNNNTIFHNFYGNIIDNGFNDNEIYNNFNSNKLGYNFNNNTLGDNLNIGNWSFYRNDIGYEFNNNTIGQEFYNNKIGNAFTNNQIVGYFYNNQILNGFDNNSLGNEIYGNKIGNAFNNNTVLNFFADNNILNYFGNNTIDNNFESNNIKNYFIFNTISDNFKNNNIGDYFGDAGSHGSGYGNTIIDNFYDNLIGNKFYSNTIELDFYRNDIGNEFFGNTLNNAGGSKFHNNVIGNRFNTNTTTDNFNGNVIGGGFNANNILGSFYSNEIGFGFNNNTTNTSFGSNVIYYYFNNNTIGINFENNIIKPYFNYNTIGSNFKRNNILTDNLSNTDFTSATIVYSSYDKTFFRRQDNTIRLSYYDSTDVLVIANITD